MMGKSIGDRFGMGSGPRVDVIWKRLVPQLGSTWLAFNMMRVVAVRPLEVTLTGRIAFIIFRISQEAGTISRRVLVRGIGLQIMPDYSRKRSRHTGTGHSVINFRLDRINHAEQRTLLLRRGRRVKVGLLSWCCVLCGRARLLTHYERSKRLLGPGHNGGMRRVGKRRTRCLCNGAPRRRRIIERLMRGASPGQR